MILKYCGFLESIELHDTTSDITVSKNPHVQQEFQISGLYEFRSYAQLKLFKFEGVEKNLTKEHEGYKSDSQKCTLE
ncbi:unnamed protein product [Brugia timori]|uniref:CUB domain-containing protein n=1 Tax=Brugia timori TaxID=42155 RepID=A0A0R3Q3E0_9BILA|nr:unnamed protein product [Brugia timori]